MIDQSEATNQLFVVERYDDTGNAGSLLSFPTPPADLRILCAVRVPADDVILALVEGKDEQTISSSFGAVGWRVDRITPATWVRPDEDGTS